MKVISSERRPIKMWLNDIEEGAEAQAKNLANLPFIHSHVAIMPDCHQGYGMPIGGVIATKGVIIPNAVGVDIGCGMCAMATTLTEIDQETIRKIFGGSKEYKGGIRSSIPVGMNHHSKKQDQSLMPCLPDSASILIVEQYYESALKQIGTLGGGNHFIEIQSGSDGRIYIMIHSGSRNIGFKVANHYNKVAIDLNEKWHTSVPAKWELAFLPLDSDEGVEYYDEMTYCVAFAKASRNLMMERVKDAFRAVIPDVDFDDPINVAHNYATMENHFGENVMVHRKGATRARSIEICIIPGSQGTSSYIAVGKGNPESFHSCSHGAGRIMSRTQAQKTLDLEKEKSRLDDLGIIHGIRKEKDLDEAAGAYKNIDEVMANQRDLVEPIIQLSPLAVMKG